jgi:hypothetical protein
MKLRAFQFSVTSLLLVGLTGCGGGGSSTPAASGPVPSTSTFPFQQAFTGLVATGWNKTFSITQTGTVACSGTGSRTVAPATTSTTFSITPTNTVPALSAVQTITWNWTNCSPASNASTFTGYYNSSNYLPLGVNSPGVNYGVNLTPPSYPATVTVGGTGITGTQNLYTNSTETTSNGHVDGSYVVTADTTSTAIITMIGKIYNAAGTLTATEQDAWRITTAGVLTPISTTIQYTSGTNLVWTYN